MPKNNLDIKNYSPNELKAMIPPKKVQEEFGVPIKTLEYLRECSIDTGKLRGPLFFKDENIILYVRKSVIVWLQQTMFASSETQETQESHQTEQVNKKNKLG